MSKLIDNRPNASERALLVGIRHKRKSLERAQADLAELEALAASAELHVCKTLMAPVGRIDPAWYVGKGKVSEIKELVSEHRAQVVIFDETLSPAQVRNLEEKMDLKVIDRGILVLDIFARRARTREAKIQVELAQLEYLLPRLTGLWAHFSRHAGGVGTKGPGETQLEVDRRQTRTRIATLKKELKKVVRSREVQRQRRKQNAPVCALVGYTNAGKSTLFNRLTRADEVTQAMMFSSLDAKSKRMHLTSASGNHALGAVLVDTVGFVSKLPPQLVASFRSTLEELKYADLLLCVLDISHPDAHAHVDEVLRVIKDMDARSLPRLWILNKVDLVEPERQREVALSVVPDPYLICSAQQGTGMTALTRSLHDRLSVREI